LKFTGAAAPARKPGRPSGIAWSAKRKAQHAEWLSNLEARHADRA
jgi:hypothetical protein